MVKFQQFLSFRTLVIDLNCEGDQKYESTGNVLSFKVSNGPTDRNTDDEKYIINVNWNNVRNNPLFKRLMKRKINIKLQYSLHFQTPVGNFEYVTLWLKTLLPICYQFAPEIILILIDFDSLQSKRKNS